MFRAARCIFFLFICTALADAQPLTDQSSQTELKRLKKSVEELSELLKQQQKRIEVLETRESATDSHAHVHGSSSHGGIDPEVGVVADIVAFATEEGDDTEGNDTVSVRELELILGAEVDRRTRLDVSVAFSDLEEVHLEEAFVTNRPMDLLTVRLGRLRPRVGFATALHRDQLATVDEPLVVEGYLGHEGLFKTGLELSVLLPWSAEHASYELLGGVIEGGVGEDGTLFGSVRRRPSFYAALRNVRELDERTTLAIQGTWMTGSSDEDASYEVRAYGAHAKLDYDFTDVNRLTLLSEAYFQDRTEPASLSDEPAHAVLAGSDGEVEPVLREHPYGFYTLAEVGISRLLSSGVRFDLLEQTNGGAEETLAYSGFVTLHQSEHLRWRLQYQHLRYDSDADDDRFWLQAVAAIGGHRHEVP